jgi:hypothetical protein
MEEEFDPPRPPSRSKLIFCVELPVSHQSWQLKHLRSGAAGRPLLTTCWPRVDGQTRDQEPVELLESLVDRNKGSWQVVAGSRQGRGRLALVGHARVHILVQLHVAIACLQCALCMRSNFPRSIANLAMTHFTLQVAK